MKWNYALPNCSMILINIILFSRSSSLKNLAFRLVTTLSVNWAGNLLLCNNKVFIGNLSMSWQVENISTSLSTAIEAKFDSSVSWPSGFAFFFLGFVVFLPHATSDEFCWIVGVGGDSSSLLYKIFDWSSDSLPWSPLVELGEAFSIRNSSSLLFWIIAFLAEESAICVREKDFLPGPSSSFSGLLSSHFCWRVYLTIQTHPRKDHYHCLK